MAATAQYQVEHIARAPRGNPQELLVFGNPSRNQSAFREVLKEGSRQVVIAKDSEGSYFHVYPYVNYGETMVKSLGKWLKLETARSKAKTWLSGGGRNPARFHVGQRLIHPTAWGDDAVTVKKVYTKTLLVKYDRDGRVTSVPKTALKPIEGNPGFYDPPPERMGGHAGWLAEMVKRMERDYRDYRKQGLSHDDAVEKTLSHTTAGKSAIAEFRKRVINAGSPAQKGPRKGESVAEYHARRVREILAKMPKAIRDVFDRNPSDEETRAIFARGRKEMGRRYAAEIKELREAIRDEGDPEKKTKLRSLLAKFGGKFFHGNPDAVESFQAFHGRDPEEILRPHLSNIMRKEYFAIGPLLAIGLDDGGWSEKQIVAHWDQLPGITFNENEGVKLAAAPPDNGAKKSKQLYVIGGNQDMTGCLRNFEGVDAAKDFVDLGDAYFVTYVARKIHDDYEPTTYTHVLGEETGVRPRLFWDRLRKQLFFAGGEYFIDLNGISPGIEN